METVLITGGTGLLGKYLLATAPDRYHVYATYHEYHMFGAEYKLELQSDESVAEVFRRTHPDIVIHTAGQGSVDMCENDFSAYYNVNVGGSYRVIRECAKIAAKFVGISTNAVFRGDAAPYDDDDMLDPVNMYGHSKLLMEMAVRHYYRDANWLIIRPILMYGWPNKSGRGNWVTRVNALLREGAPLKMVDDTKTQPLYAKDCANFIWKVLLDNRTGTYNVAGDTKCSLYEFAILVADMFELDPAGIEPVPSSVFHSLAPRPVDTTYTLRRMVADGYTPSNLRVGLCEMREEYGG